MYFERQREARHQFGRAGRLAGGAVERGHDAISLELERQPPNCSTAAVTTTPAQRHGQERPSSPAASAGRSGSGAAFALVQLNTNSRNAILSENQMSPASQVNGGYGTGDSQPPRNSIEPIADSRIMLAYSPRKNRAKVIDEYSVWKPGNELGFRHRQVERRAVGLGQRRDEEDHEHRQQRQREPVEEPALTARSPPAEIERADARAGR